MVVVGLFAGIVVRLVDLQAVSAGRYRSLGLSQRVRTVTLPAERGSIFDRNGNDLAVSAPAKTVYADPRVITDPAGTIAKLAPVIGLDPAATASLTTAVSDHARAFVYVARQIDPTKAAAVTKLQLPGISSYDESKRYYPGAGVAASVIGFTGIDGNGLGGLEYAYDAQLTGTTGTLSVERDPRGREIPDSQHQYTAPQRGQDLVLSIDQSVQYQAEQVLLDGVRAASAKGGMALVMDVTTGDILAMATVDGATASTPVRVSSAAEKLRPVTDVFEPGSTNKVITASAALQEGLISPSTPIEVPFSLTVDGKDFEDHDWHPVQIWTPTDIIRESSNVGTIKIAQMLGKDRFDEYLRKFGLGTKTALGLPGESPGILLDPSHYNATSMATMPIGNGIAVTALQMLGVYTSIANGGESRPPRLVDATVDADGRRHEVAATTGTRVVSPEVATEVSAMLRAAVTDGTAKEAAVAGYPVSGKTGTARKPPYDKPPYKYIASFAGFAPSDNPRLAAIIVLDEPQPFIYGGEVAAPLFSQIMQFALRHEGVPARSVDEFPPPPAPTTRTAAAQPTAAAGQTAGGTVAPQSTSSG